MTLSISNQPPIGWPSMPSCHALTRTCGPAAMHTRHGMNAATKSNGEPACVATCCIMATAAGGNISSILAAARELEA